MQHGLNIWVEFFVLPLFSMAIEQSKPYLGPRARAQNEIKNHTYYCYQGKLFKFLLIFTGVLGT